MMETDDLTGMIVDTAFHVHQGLGPGLLESVYEAVLAAALQRRGLKVERQKSVAFSYDGIAFDEGFRVDLLIEGRVVVELKSVEKLAPVHSKQVLTYLRLMKLPVGLLINFGAGIFKEGLHRIVNGYEPSASPRLRVNQTGMGTGEISRGGAERGKQGFGILSGSAAPREPKSRRRELTRRRGDAERGEGE